MQFEKTAGKQPVHGVQLMFYFEAVCFEFGDQLLRVLIQQPIEMPFHAAVLVERMKPDGIDAALLENGQPFPRKIPVEYNNSFFINFISTITKRIS